MKRGNEGGLDVLGKLRCFANDWLPGVPKRFQIWKLFEAWPEMLRWVTLDES